MSTSTRINHDSLVSRIYFTIQGQKSAARWTPKWQKDFLHAAKQLVRHGPHWLYPCSSIACKNVRAKKDFKAAVADVQSYRLCRVCELREQADQFDSSERSVESRAAYARSPGSASVIEVWAADFSYLPHTLEPDEVRFMPNRKFNSALSKWSKAVRERDNHTCQHCGAKESLVAHHSVPLSVDEGRPIALSLSNGTTLCVACHAQEHSP